MQGDLISRSATIEWLERFLDPWADRYECCYEIEHEIPAVDAVPVVNARWIRDDIGNTRCSNCHTRLPFRHCYDDEDGYEWDDEIDETPWCMHCGARMDGEP